MSVGEHTHDDLTLHSTIVAHRTYFFFSFLFGGTLVERMITSAHRSHRFSSWTQKWKRRWTHSQAIKLKCRRMNGGRKARVKNECWRWDLRGWGVVCDTKKKRNKEKRLFFSVVRFTHASRILFKQRDGARARARFDFFLFVAICFGARFLFQPLQWVASSRETAQPIRFFMYFFLFWIRCVSMWRKSILCVFDFCWSLAASTSLLCTQRTQSGCHTDFNYTHFW